jgi:hypothetical protein
VVASAGARPVSQFAPVFHSPPLVGPIHVAVVCASPLAKLLANNVIPSNVISRVFVIFISFTFLNKLGMLNSSRESGHL